MLLLVHDSLDSLIVILCDALVLNNRRTPKKRRTSNKLRTKISVKLISAAALNRGFTVNLFIWIYVNSKIPQVLIQNS